MTLNLAVILLFPESQVEAIKTAYPRQLQAGMSGKGFFLPWPKYKEGWRGKCSRNENFALLCCFYRKFKTPAKKKKKTHTNFELYNNFFFHFKVFIIIYINFCS